MSSEASVNPDGSPSVPTLFVVTQEGVAKKYEWENFKKAFDTADEITDLENQIDEIKEILDNLEKGKLIKVTITGITQDIVHDFNTYDIVCEAYDTSTLYNLPIKYKRKNLNEVTIEFDNPVPNSVRLMITKK